MDLRTAHALVRFGLGSATRPNGGGAPPVDPDAWLLNQLRAPEPSDFMPPGNAVEGLTAWRADREDKPPPGESRARALYRAQGLASVAHATTTETPFRERLVWFWSNHFTVSIRRGQCLGLAGAFVREAIRPHVTGRFQDMLLAVMRHPAMLLYLDNAGSTGPDSVVGRRGKRGINENLARECLELHTVTPAAGYAQADVVQLAHVLTGWSLERRDNPGYRFRPNLHQPGDKTLLGRSFPEGEAGGETALRFLADHPATHRHLATKLVRHFVADAPPSDAVRAVEAALRDRGGDL